MLDSNSIKYQALCSDVLENTGYVLPIETPPIGLEIEIDRPNKDIYQEGNKRAVCIFMEDGVLIISKKPHEEYLFSEGTKSSYQSYKESSSKIRLEEERLDAAALYFRSDKEVVLGHPVLVKMNIESIVALGNGQHVDYAPEGIKFGELRQSGDSLLQLFWAFKNNSLGADSIVLRNVRCHDVMGSSGLVGVKCIDPSFHIHQLVHSSPVVWCCGFVHAQVLKSRFPSCTVIEAFDIESLISLLGKLNLGSKNVIYALNKVQKLAFDNLMENGRFPSPSKFSLNYSNLSFIPLDEDKGGSDG